MRFTRTLLLAGAISICSSVYSWGASLKDTLTVRSRDGATSVVGLWKSNAKKANTAPVAVWFHGGMTSANCEKGLVAGNDLSEILPNFWVMSASACRDRHWVTPSAIQWVDAALDSIAHRRGLAVDSVYLLGVSDGALGAIAYSIEGRRTVKARLLVSSFGKMLGEAPAIAAQPKLRTGRWQFLQGGSDRLYPPNETVPWIETFCKNVGTPCDLKFDPAGEHDWQYWKEHHKDLILKVFKEK